MRFIHAACEFSQEHSVPLRTIALFTEPDRQSMFVREADEAFCLGAAYFTDPETQRPRVAISTMRDWNTRSRPRALMPFG